MDKSLEDNIKRYLQAIYLKPNRALEIRKVGLNNNGRMRILLYASAGTDLKDYAVYFQNNNNEPVRCFFRFPQENSIILSDGYICVYVDNTNRNAVMNGNAIRTFHMDYGDDVVKDIIHNGYKACLIKISLTNEVRI